LHFINFDIKKFLEFIKKINKTIFDFMLLIVCNPNNLKKGLEDDIFGLDLFDNVCENKCVYKQITLENYSQGFYNLILELQKIYKNEKVFRQFTEATNKQTETQILVQEKIDTNDVDNVISTESVPETDNSDSQIILNENRYDLSASKNEKTIDEDTNQANNSTYTLTPINYTPKIDNRISSYDVVNNSNDNKNDNNFICVPSNNYFIANPNGFYVSPQNSEYDINNQLQSNYTNLNQQQTYLFPTCNIQRVTLMQTIQGNDKHMSTIQNLQPQVITNGQNFYYDNNIQTQMVYPQQINHGQNIYAQMPFTYQQQPINNASVNNTSVSQQQIHDNRTPNVEYAPTLQTTQGYKDDMIKMQNQQPLSITNDQNLFCNNNVQQTQMFFA
ncbi:hypothetical protein COBT_000147, partial [Conglomerata obtusa]